MIQQNKIFLSFTKRFVIAFFLLSVQCRAQDTVVKRNSEKIIAKILEVLPSEIKYKMFNYQDGPLITVPKWELKEVIYKNGMRENYDSTKPPVAVKEIEPKKDLSIFISGKFYYYKALRITESDMLEVTKSVKDKRVLSAHKKTRELRFTRQAFTGAGVASGALGLMFFTGIIPLNNGSAPMSGTGNRGSRRGGQNSALTTYRHTVGGYFMLTGLGLGVVSLVFKFEERKHAHLTVKLYNKTLGE